MPGIAPARKHARWFSLTALFAYLGVLTLLAFGHHCVPAGMTSAQGDCSARAITPHAQILGAEVASAAHDLCLACALTEQTNAAASTAAGTAAPEVSPPDLSPAPELHVRATPFPSTSPRGPPHS